MFPWARMLHALADLSSIEVGHPVKGGPGGNMMPTIRRQWDFAGLGGRFNEKPYALWQWLLAETLHLEGDSLLSPKRVVTAR